MRDVLHWLPFPQRISRVLGVAVLVWLGALLSARSLPPSLFLRRPSYTTVLCSRKFGGPIRPLCDNENPFFFCGWSNDLPIEVGTSQTVPVLSSTTFSRLFFFAWPESGAPLSRNLEGALYKF